MADFADLHFKQDSEGQGCPFCRCEIKGTEQIVVDPFDDHPWTDTPPPHSHHMENEDDDPVSV